MKMLTPANANQISTLHPIKRFNDKLCINTQNAKVIIDKMDILYLKANSNYCEIHLKDATKHLCSKSMKEINSRIHHPDFVQVHSSYIINSTGLKLVDSAHNFLTLITDKEIPISRSRKPQLKEFMNLRFD